MSAMGGALTLSSARPKRSNAEALRPNDSRAGVLVWHTVSFDPVRHRFIFGGSLTEQHPVVLVGR